MSPTAYQHGTNQEFLQWKRGDEEISIISSWPFFVYGKMTAQKHGYKSASDSIAGLSESGANAEHTGKSCSRLELVVRECGLMLQRMVSVFLFCCHTSLRICRIRSHVPGPRDMGERNRKPVYRDSWLSYLPKLHSDRNIRDIHGRREENPSMEFPDFLLHTFILHKPLIFTTSLENFVLK